MIRLLQILQEKNKYSDYLNGILKKNEIDIEYLKRYYDDINTYQMYNVPFHGLYHAEKVCLYALILAKKYNLNEIETQIICDAALYHDIGRHTDYEDSTHGLVSSSKIESVIDKTNNAYQNPANIVYLKAIVEAHSLTFEDKKFIFSNYDYDNPDLNLDYEEYSKLYNILLDSDALDRTRFRKTTEAALKEDYLRLPESKELVNFAQILNQYYTFIKSKSDFQKLNNLYNPNDSTKEKEGCFHGISSNFFALESILKYGILSEFAMQEIGLNSNRNFFGNNNSLFVSVIDDISYSKDGKAKNNFLKENISLYCLVTNLCDGKTKDSQSKYIDGLPTNSGEYEDEKFVFYKILPEQIYSVVIPKNLINTNIRELNYMSGSLNYDIIDTKVRFYLEKLEEYHVSNFDTKSLNKLLEEYKNIVVSFEKLSNIEQKNSLREFLNELEIKLELINKEIQEIVDILWHIELSKNFDNVINVNDVVSHILQKSFPNFQLQDCGEELLYILNHEKVNKK